MSETLSRIGCANLEMGGGGVKDRAFDGLYASSQSSVGGSSPKP